MTHLNLCLTQGFILMTYISNRHITNKRHTNRYPSTHRGIGTEEAFYKKAPDSVFKDTRVQLMAKRHKIELSKIST